MFLINLIVFQFLYEKQMFTSQPGKSGLDLEDEDVEHDLNGTNMGLISKF